MRTIMATLIGSIHLLAAAALVGGVFFSKFIMPKATAELDPPTRGKVLATAGRYFSMMVFGSLAILLLTGLARSIALGLLSPAVLFGSTYGTILLVKIALFVVGTINAVIIAKTGMSLSELGKNGAEPAAMQVAQAKMSLVQNLGLILAVAIVILAVALRVIGIPEAG